MKVRLADAFRLRFADWFHSLLTSLVFRLRSWQSSARLRPDLWPKWQKHEPASAQKIDHSAWDKWLKKYLVAPHPSGVNRVRYGSVAPEDRKALKSYLENLQSLPISAYNRSGAKGVLDQSLQRTDGGGGSVPLSD